ncbi:hypothetical protein PAHAL_9G372800 [Panicum hallii]|jgi:hypothetical protein|uniref:Uncharacterized protein n=1 Tax=Panicum hallii TaxID=206008 RepID=A0A2T8I3T0_9POAL|nr:hypothetical protein PAHAL_9G372800 [Panicum hallii]
MVVGMHERMVGLAGRFRRGAAALAAMLGEEALVGMLQRQATKTDAVRAMVEGWRRMNAKIRSCDPSIIDLARPYFVHHQLAIWLLC